MEQTKTRHVCRRTHYVHGSVSEYHFSPPDKLIKIIFKLDDGSFFRLFYPCENRNLFELIAYDLDHVSYWKISYLCDTRRITKMEQQNWCSIQ